MRVQLGPMSWGYTLYVEYKHGKFVLTEEDNFSSHKSVVVSFNRREAEALVVYLTDKIEETK